MQFWSEKHLFFIIQLMQDIQTSLFPCDYININICFIDLQDYNYYLLNWLVLNGRLFVLETGKILAIRPNSLVRTEKVASLKLYLIYLNAHVIMSCIYSKSVYNTIVGLISEVKEPWKKIILFMSWDSRPKLKQPLNTVELSVPAVLMSLTFLSSDESPPPLC